MMKLPSLRKIKRELLIRYAYFKGLTRVPYPPCFIAIEPTNYCNYRCVMCPQSSKNSSSIPRGFMSGKTFDRVLNEVKSFALEVFIQLGGEPLLHPELIEFIKKAKDEDLLVSISTNASLLTGDLGEGLIKAGLDKLIITFTDKGKERYESIWHGGDYDRTEKNIKEFMRLKNSSKNPKVIFQIIKFSGEDRDLTLDNEFFKRWGRLGVDSFFPIWATYWAGSFKDEAVHRYQEAPRDSYYRPCGAIWRSIVIHWDGNVSPCCNDLNREYIIGNVETESLRDIWNGEEMKRLREALVQGRYKEIELCRNCLALWGRLPSEKRRWYGAVENRIKRVK